MFFFPKSSKPKTVDEIVESLTGIITDLNTTAVDRRDEADWATQQIILLETTRDGAIDEANRAQRIADRVSELIA
jgi:hypothetical protein